MKFNCDYFRDRRAAKHVIKVNRMREWNKTFAWLPTRVDDNDCRWLEMIERKALFSESIIINDYYWIYRATQPKEVIA